MEPMSDATSYERRLLQKSWDKKIPINGSLELLPLCNLNCEMCYVRLSREEMQAYGHIRSAQEWLSLAEEMKTAGVVFLLLTGGEPLLHPEFKEIYLGLRKMGMVITINTNGTLINEEWSEFFAQNQPRRINITLYGTGNPTYERLCHAPKGYDQAIQGISFLKNKGVDVRLGCSITALNKEDLEGFFKIGSELELFCIADTYMVSASRERRNGFNYESRCNPEEAAGYRMLAWKHTLGEQNFIPFIERHIFEIEHIVPEEGEGCVGCYAGNCSFAISWLGDMHPCVTMSRPSANVFKEGFTQAWNHITDETGKIRTSSRCQACNLRPICHTCAGNALVETGDYSGTPDYLCRYSEETYRLMKEELQQYRERTHSVIPGSDNEESLSVASGSDMENTHYDQTI